MNLISVTEISKTMLDKQLFKNITFGIDSGQKIALIGVNGCGKSTLLRIIAQKEEADEGIIAYNKDTKINFLEQVPTFHSGDTILDHIFKDDNEITRLIKKYEYLCQKLNTNYTEEDRLEFEQVMHEIEIRNAWSYENEIKSILTELGITDLTIKMDVLSGGMLKKVHLAQALIRDANLLIFDEPTNHLDIDTTEWLQEYLQKTDKALLMVTHDRYFLDKVCNCIFEIENQSLYKYYGNYTYYLEKKAELEYNSQKRDERLEIILRKELDWLKQGPKARTTKQKARLMKIQNMINQQQQNKNMSEKDQLELSIINVKLGKKILELHNISKSFGSKVVLKPYSYVFKPEDRIGIVGPNGSGKTTFLNILTQRIETDTGKVITGMHTRIGYFDQYSNELDPNKNILEFVKETAEYLMLNDGSKVSAGQMLERFLFPSSMHYQKISRLSGGERRRLYLLHILMQNPNFLIFDEPTNDLDIKTLSILEDFLNDFHGCLLVVSHDRYFMDKIVDYLFIFDGKGNIKEFAGSYSDYLEYRKNEILKNNSEKNQEKKVFVKPQKEKDLKKLSYKEKQELISLENEIEALENEKSEIEILFNSGEKDPAKFEIWSNRYKEIEKLLSEKLERWEYLASIES